LNQTECMCVYEKEKNDQLRISLPFFCSGFSCSLILNRKDEEGSRIRRIGNISISPHVELIDRSQKRNIHIHTQKK
jgi:hypothetical protein